MLFSDATTGQTKERAYPFIQILLTGLMTRRSAKEEEVGRPRKIKACSLGTHEIFGSVFKTLPG